VSASLDHGDVMVVGNRMARFFVFLGMDRCEEDGTYDELVFVGRIDGSTRIYTGKGL
jgi:hypothetical protein